MTISASTYFSNSIVGQPHIGDGIDIHRADTTPRHYVGLGFERADGAKFRYEASGYGKTTFHLPHMRKKNRTATRRIKGRGHFNLSVL